MATEFNYVVNVDTSRVMGAMSEVRSQMGMAMMPQAGAQIPAGQGMGAVVGGAAHGIGAMSAAMVRFPVSGRYAGLYNTFTDPAIAYTPHYGAVTASTTPGMERLIDREGLAAAQRLRPPGVGAADFYREVQANRIEREAEARRQAFTAARTTFMSGALGMGAGTLAAAPGGWIGRAIGGRFGSFGRMAGGLIGSLGGFMIASDIVGGAVQEHYAAVERAGGITRELGEIMGAGRGLTREQRYRMGMSARGAARDLNMDVQAVGDVLAGARQMGMLPRADNPAQLRSRITEFVRAIDEGAQMLGTSMGNAMRVVRGMTGMGFGAREGVERLVGMAGAAGISPMAMYGVGMRGAGVARQIEMPGRMGFDLFTQGVLSAAGAGLTRQELGYVGGVTGLGQQIAMSQMQHAMGPYGRMQLMAAAGGQALPEDVYATGAQALANLSRGGSPIGNWVQFMINEPKLREAAGARGIQAMQRNAFMSQARIIMQMDQNVSEEEAFRAIAMSQGMSATAAMGLYRGPMSRGGGGGGGAGGMAVMEAQYKASVGDVVRQWGGRMDELGFDRTIKGRIIERARQKIENVSTADKWALAGGGIGMLGGPKGAIVGAGVGYVAGAIYDFVGKGGLSLDMDPVTQADREFLREAQNMDRLEAKAMRRAGILPFDRGAMGRLLGGRMDIDAVQIETGMADPYGIAGANVAAYMGLLGIQPVEAGPGTTKVGEQYFPTKAVVGGTAGAMGEANILKGRGSHEIGMWLSKVRGRRHGAITRVKQAAARLTGDVLAPDEVEKVSQEWAAAVEDLLAPVGGEMPEALAGTGISTAARREAVEELTGLDIRGIYKRAKPKLRGALLVTQGMVKARERAVDQLGDAIMREGAFSLMEETSWDQGTTESKAKIMARNKRVRGLLLQAAQDPSKRGAVAKKLEFYMATELGGETLPGGRGVPAAVDAMMNSDFFDRVREIAQENANSGGYRLDRDRPSGGRGGGRGKRKSTRSAEQYQGAFNPIGFGETESAMALINKSLKQTAAMIEKLHGKVNRKKRAG